jgi:hypothetical protein
MEPPALFGQPGSSPDCKVVLELSNAAVESTRGEVMEMKAEFLFGVGKRVVRKAVRGSHLVGAPEAKGIVLHPSSAYKTPGLARSQQ